MKDQRNIKNKSHLLEDIIKSRKGKINLKYFSPIQNSRKKYQKENIISNKINIKELSKLSDRPIKINKQIQNIQREHYLSVDRANKNIENSSSFNNKNNNLKYKELNNKKNIVIFTECPKTKISDYILKNNKKKKMYQLTYLEENDLNYDKFINEKINHNYNSNREYNPRIITRNKNLFNLNTYDSGNSLQNDIYIDRLNSNRRIKNNYNSKTLYTNNQNNDQLNVIKIQSAWRGFRIRRFLVNRLNNFYNIMRIYNCLYNIFYNHSKPIFKIILNLLKNRKSHPRYKNYTNNRIKIENKNGNNKRIINTINNKNINIPYEKNIKKVNIIEKKNINVFIPGEKINKEKENNFVYKRKKNSPKNSSSLINKNNKSELINNDNNIITKDKTKYYERFRNINFKNKVKQGMNNIIDYIKKKNILLYFPLFLYRLKIIYKMKLTEHKYKCLFNIIQIKERLILSKYFNIYRNNIFSQTVKKMISEKKTCLKKNIQKLDNINNRANNPINNKELLINTNEDKIINNNSINNNILIGNNKNNIKDKKILLLNKIIKRKESKLNNLLLIQKFKNWKNYTSVKSKLKSNTNRNNRHLILKNKNSAISSKKKIKVKKIKSAHVNYFSQTKSLNSGKMFINSFDSDNINVRKMKIKKLNVLIESREIKTSLTKEFNLKNKNSQILENSHFIKKIANITIKISNKNNIYKCFIYWKKKSKENK